MADMSDAQDQNLLDALLDSWDRNNTIMLNLLRALPESGLEARATEGGRSVAELFTHIHYVRLAFVSEDAPEFAMTGESAVVAMQSRDARTLVRFPAVPGFQRHAVKKQTRASPVR